MVPLLLCKDKYTHKNKTNFTDKKKPKQKTKTKYKKQKNKQKKQTNKQTNIFYGTDCNIQKLVQEELVEILSKRMINKMVA